MKTPREILLQHHQQVNAKLDAIRHTSVAAVCDRRIKMDATPDQRSQTAATTILRTLWRELVCPSRHIWAGIATAWVLIVAVNFHDRRGTELARQDLTPPSPEVLMALREPERWFNDFDGSSHLPDADPPKKIAPAPRSEMRNQLLLT